MSDDEVVSPRIAALRIAAEAGDRAPVDSFWTAVSQQGTPLVEPADGGDSEVLVTFLWRGAAGTRNVRVVTDDLLGKTPAQNAMVPIRGTDVWYKSYRLAADLRFEYLLAPDDPALSAEPPATEADATASWQLDPLNPKRYLISDDGELPDWDEFFRPWSTWVRRINSLVELPKAPTQRWVERREDVAQGTVQKHRFKSAALDNDRAVYVYTPAGYPTPAEPPGLLVMSDAWVYHEIVPTPTVLDNLIASGTVPPMVAVLVGHPSLADRNAELGWESGAAPFASLLVDEVMPWVRANYRITDDPRRIILAGASAGGDVAAAIAIDHPDTFGNVIAQSAVFGRPHPSDAEPEWLARKVALSAPLPIRFYVEAGLQETDPGSDGVSILVSTRHFRTVLEAKGYPVVYHEYNGGHQPVCWRGTLGDALAALTS